jgi:glycosyltransferase involved in cell wall biosynthesis
MEHSGFPRISIITTSFNQARFLEEAIRSVLGQGYPNLEYIIIDGGSTDESVDIIRKYADRLTYWVSESDKSHGEALNKGFRRSTGEIMGWINSDDKYLPGAFKIVSQIFSANPAIEWLTSETHLSIDEKGEIIGKALFLNLGRRGFKEGFYLPDINVIPQESTFWRRSLWERAGGYIDANLKIVPDFELWARFWEQAELYSIPAALGAVRSHGDRITSRLFKDCCQQARKIWAQHGGAPPKGITGFFRDELLSRRIPIVTYMLLNRRKRLSIYNKDTLRWNPWLDTFALLNPLKIIRKVEKIIRSRIGQG